MNSMKLKVGMLVLGALAISGCKTMVRDNCDIYLGKNHSDLTVKEATLLYNKGYQVIFEEAPVGQFEVRTNYQVETITEDYDYKYRSHASGRMRTGRWIQYEQQFTLLVIQKIDMGRGNYQDIVFYSDRATHRYVDSSSGPENSDPVETYVLRQELLESLPSCKVAK